MTKQVRDWQEDKQLSNQADNWEFILRYEDCGDIEENGSTIASDVVVNRAGDIFNVFEALKHWLQQYAAEKERADKLQVELSEYTEANWKAFEREKKLREAIEAAINENHLWQNAGNALEVIERHLKDTLASLYPEEGTPQIKPLNNEDMQASQAFINRAMKEEEAK